MAPARLSRPSLSIRLPRVRRAHRIRAWRRRDYARLCHRLISLVMLASVLWSSSAPLWEVDLVEAQTLSQQATLTVISQPVEVQRSSGSRVDGSSGMTLAVGDRVFTGPGAAAQLTFFQGSEVEIGAESEIMVQQMEQRGGASTVGIGQAVGNTISRVASLFNPASRFQVNTPSAVAVVRGTILGTNVNRDGSQSFTCLEGNCEVKAAGQSQTLRDGDSTFIPPPPPLPTGVPSNRGEGRQDDQGGGNSGEPLISTPFPKDQLPNVVATAALTAVARGVILNTPTAQVIATSTPVPGQPTRTPAATSTAIGSPTPAGSPTPQASPTPESSPTPQSSPTSAAPTPSPVVPTPPAVPSPTEEPPPPPPADTPVPSATPSATPSPSPSQTPSPTSSPTATPAGTAAPTVQPGTNVAVTLGTGVAVTFGGVTAAGDVSLGSSATTPGSLGLPSGMTLLNGSVYTLSTTASVSGDFTVQWVFGSAFSGARPASDVQLQYRDGNGQWVIPSQTVNASTYTITATIPSGTVSLGAQDVDGGLQGMRDGTDGTDVMDTGEVTRLFMRATTAVRELFSSVVQSVSALVAPLASAQGEVATPTASAGGTATHTATLTSTAAASSTATSTATASPTASATASSTASPTASPTAAGTVAPAASATAIASAPATTVASATATATTTAVATATRTVAPSATPRPLRASVASSPLLTFVIGLPEQTNTLSITKGGTGAGTISTSSSVPASDITCATACTTTQFANYPTGTSVTVSAISGSGSTFTGWGGACASYTTSPTCPVTMDAAKSVSAIFDVVVTPTAMLHLSKTGFEFDAYAYGSVLSTPAGLSCDATCSLASASFDVGQVVTLTATVGDSRAAFLGWDSLCAAYASSTTCALTMPSATVNIGATFQSPPTGTYAQSVLSDGPLGYWRLGELVGTRAVDGSGNLRHGTYVNGASHAGSGALLNYADPAGSFDGVDDYVHVPDSAALSVTGPFTLEAWINASAYSAPVSPIAEKYTCPDSSCSSGVNGYALRLDGSGRLQGHVLAATGAQEVILAGTTPVGIGQWRHAAFVFDGTHLKLYLDGQLDASVSSAVAPTDGSAGLKIGGYGNLADPGDPQNGCCARFNGSVDEVAVYGSSLSASRVQAHYTASGRSLTPVSPTALYVQNGGTDTGTCVSGSPCATIAYALSQAADSATIHVGTGAFTEPAGVILTQSVTIVGNGPTSTYIQPAASAGIATSRVVNVTTTTGTVVLSNLTLRYGKTTGAGAGIQSNASAGSVNLVNVEVTDNQTTSDGGGLNGYNFTLTNAKIANNTANRGGGIRFDGNLTATNSTVSGNAASGSGGIRSFGSGGTVVLNGVAITGNSASSTSIGDTGGFHLNSPHTATIINSTLSGNSAPSGGWGSNLTVNSGSLSLLNTTVYGTSAGASVRAGSANAISLKNTLLANNGAGTNCVGSSFLSQGYNLSSDSSCAPLFTGSPGGDLHNAPAYLGTLADNGGSTQTHALLPGSLAVDAGTSLGCPGTDQRGTSRPFDGNGDAVAVCDIGAYETETVTPVNQLTVSKAGAGSGTVTAGDSAIVCDAACTIQSYAYPSGTVVTLSAAPATGSVFVGWSGDCSGTATCVVTLDTTRSASAAFTPDQVNVTVTSAVVWTGPNNGLGTINNLTIANGGSITHAPGDSSLEISVSGTVTIESGGSINLDGKGCAPGQVWSGATCTGGGGTVYSGGSYGGWGGPYGGGGTSNSPYGSLELPAELGAGGAGGSGGGRLNLSAPSLVLDGTISANGTGGGGAGSGGAILLDVGFFTGSAGGTVEARGGTASGYGAGGGGRIAIYATTASFPGQVWAPAGDGQSVGGAGTYFRQVPSSGGTPAVIVHGGLSAQAGLTPLTGLSANTSLDVRGNALVDLTPGVATIGAIIVDGASSRLDVRSTAATPLQASGVTVQNGGTLSHPQVSSGGHTGLHLSAAAVTVASGASIDANGRGCPAGQQWSGGVCTAGATGTSGGSYGGVGGQYTGSPNATYGTASDPAEPGSGGAGGAAGGLIRISASTVTINGAVRANGIDGAGGGSGGGIRIDAGLLSGTVSGTIEANGGNGPGYGAGGGGRVALYASSSTYSGTATATGGSGGAPGAAGTVYEPNLLLTVTAAGTNSSAGTVSSSPGSISCGIVCTESFPYGQSVTLVAAGSGGPITGTTWSAPECSTPSDSCTFTMTSARSVIATLP